MKKCFVSLIVILFTLILFASDEADLILIKNAKIFPVVGENLEKGDILIKAGKIAKVGINLEAPSNVRIIDASGMRIYPGFIDAYTQLGLAEVYSIPGSVDTSELGRENPEIKVTWALNPQSIHFATSRINGTTSALVAPSGGTFSGIPALVRMDGWTIDEMLIKDEIASIINFPITPRPIRDLQVKTVEEEKTDVTSKLVDKIKEYLAEAGRYNELKKAAREKGESAPNYNTKYEALIPVLEGKMPVLLSVEKAKDIKLAIKFIKDEKLKAIFRGCVQGYQIADKIAEAKIPVIIDNLWTDPSDPDEAYDAQWRNASELVKAGVTICFSTGVNPSTSKDLPYHAARAVAFGLDHDEAIRSLTINPAKILGVADKIGSIEEGKDADLFITTGDPLDLRSEVKYLIIKGKTIDLDNYWESLYKKYEKRPM